MRRSLFGIKQFIKQLKKGKSNCIFPEKYMVTDEVGVPNDVFLWLRTYHKCFSLIKWILGKNKKKSFFTFDVHIIDHSEYWILFTI